MNNFINKIRMILLSLTIMLGFNLGTGKAEDHILDKLSLFKNIVIFRAKFLLSATYGDSVRGEIIFKEGNGLIIELAGVSYREEERSKEILNFSQGLGLIYDYSKKAVKKINYNSITASDNLDTKFASFRIISIFMPLKYGGFENSSVKLEGAEKIEGREFNVITATIAKYPFLGMKCKIWQAKDNKAIYKFIIYNDNDEPVWSLEVTGLELNPKIDDIEFSVEIPADFKEFDISEQYEERYRALVTLYEIYHYNEQLLAENEELNTHNKELRIANEVLSERLKSSSEALSRENEELNTHNKELRIANEVLSERLKSSSEALSRENEELNTHNKELRIANEVLSERLKSSSEALSRENEELRIENQTLKSVNDQLRTLSERLKSSSEELSRKNKELEEVVKKSKYSREDFFQEFEIAQKEIKYNKIIDKSVRNVSTSNSVIAVDYNSNFVIIGLGEDDGVEIEQIYTVVASEHSLGIVIRRTFKDMAVAEPIIEGFINKIKIGDRIIKTKLRR